MTFPNNFVEIDFLAVESGKSGDAITIRSAVNGSQVITVVDGGFTDMGETIVKHLQDNYDDPAYIHNVVLTHPDGDHAKGLKFVLENVLVAHLWMNRPWLYVSELLPKFKNCTSADWLRNKLRSEYSNVADLEDIANERRIPIMEAFPGTSIGHFTVLAPSKQRYLDLIVSSDRTPEPAAASAYDFMKALSSLTETIARAAINLVKAAWGVETFSASDTSSENDMSLVQYADFGGVKFLLTGDAGRGTLSEAADYATYLGVILPGIDRFQVPHHGSRRNVSTEVLDRWLGTRLSSPVPAGSETFQAFISSAAADPDHPRKAVERAIHHRGGKVYATEGASIRTGWNAPERAGWTSATSRPYPEEQEQ
ncbi:MAG TPA: competence protein ComEC [Allosphingosinicella sp.]|jgi:beta-lactamase superfamily II metal-dependent hydrolase|uniref:ComEC/Rec2 family competence protein n=1 Tax=Allosphingosinicella sp. TaxID=2823234 RepID=UPI002F2787DA